MSLNTSKKVFFIISLNTSRNIIIYLPSSSPSSSSPSSSSPSPSSSSPSSLHCLSQYLYLPHLGLIVHIQCQISTNLCGIVQVHLQPNTSETPIQMFMFMFICVRTHTQMIIRKTSQVHLQPNAKHQTPIHYVYVYVYVYMSTDTHK